MADPPSPWGTATTALVRFGPPARSLCADVNWILTNLSRPNQLPVVNVVAVLAILLSLIPVWIAQRLTADPVAAAGRAAEAGV